MNATYFKGIITGIFLFAFFAISLNVLAQTSAEEYQIKKRIPVRVDIEVENASDIISTVVTLDIIAQVLISNSQKLSETISVETFSPDGVTTNILTKTDRMPITGMSDQVFSYLQEAKNQIDKLDTHSLIAAGGVTGDSSNEQLKASDEILNEVVEWSEVTKAPTETSPIHVTIGFAATTCKNLANTMVDAEPDTINAFTGAIFFNFAIDCRNKVAAAILEMARHTASH